MYKKPSTGADAKKKCEEMWYIWYTHIAYGPCRHSRDDLVDTVVAPASAEAAATAVADVRDEQERVGKYLARLKEVRNKRSAMEVSKGCRGTQYSIMHCNNRGGT